MKKYLVMMMAFLPVLMASAPAFAQDGSEASINRGLIGLAAGLGMGIGTFGGAMGQGRTAAAAMEGIARNPQAAAKVQTPMIIALALTESLVLFTLVITFFLQNKV
ncbi:MAG: ATP synthase F0 subunit C [Myxococcota bacterium]